jgi:2-methylfumaryl-CoA hydratase
VQAIMSRNAPAKTNPGNYFEDFILGQELAHATPRTVTEGDVSLYTALYGTRFAVQSADAFAQSLGLPGAPVDDLLVFHIVFGKTVPDVSLNAVANLGYAECRFGVPVYPGDTLMARSTVIGLRENSNRESGVVYVRSEGVNQAGETVLDYVRWVMVRKRDKDAPVAAASVPKLAASVAADDLVVPEELSLEGYDATLAGSPYRWSGYAIGERIDHVDGMTIEEAEHMIATRLYQNTAKVHFDQRLAAGTRFGRRLIYGGHVISMARALSFNGLANAFKIAAINAGSHTNPTLAGDTIYAWSEVVEKVGLEGRDDIGALRLRTRAVKNADAASFPDKGANGKVDPSVVLDLDYWALMPR